MKKTAYHIAIIGVAVIFTGASLLSAEEGQTVSDAVLKQVTQLQNLRQNDPQAYQQKIAEKKAAIMEQMQQMGQGGQSRFRQFVAKNQNRRFERLQNFRQQNPQAFERFMDNRMQRFQNMAEKNPERFQKFLNNHPNVRERMAARMQQNLAGGLSAPGQAVGQRRLSQAAGPDRFIPAKDGGVSQPGQRVGGQDQLFPAPGGQNQQGQKVFQGQGQRPYEQRPGGNFQPQGRQEARPLQGQDSNRGSSQFGGMNRPMQQGGGPQGGFRPGGMPPRSGGMQSSGGGPRGGGSPQRGGGPRGGRGER